MAKTKIDLRQFNILIENASKRARLNASRSIASSLKNKILSLISKGISPIEGNGRFKSYKPSTKKRKRYPDTVKSDFPDKRRRPVNLELSGKFLRALKVFPKSLNIITFGFFSEYGETLELGHREGANTQAKRPIIPDFSKGEALAKSIQADILKSLKQAMENELKRSR